MSDTELKLQFWRAGQTGAERLACSILSLSGYSDVDPQLPLGGPDGKKDILCSKGERLWLGAVYFPSSPRSFSETRKKFASDLQGAVKFERNFAFITNQNLTPRERKKLHDIAQEVGIFLDLFHLQRLVTALDSPSGYGPRIEHLRIRMTTEEQLGWVEETRRQTKIGFDILLKELRTLRKSSDTIHKVQSEILSVTRKSFASKSEQSFSDDSPDLLTANTFTRTDQLPELSALLSLPLILLIHRLTCFDLPENILGKIRTAEVFVATSDGVRSSSVSPSRPENVVSDMETLVGDWNTKWVSLRTFDEKIALVAYFHHRFLFVHPFLDGNGRVARALLLQQCLDCFGKVDMTLFPRGQKYYEALKSADNGNFDNLHSIIVSLVE